MMQYDFSEDVWFEQCSKCNAELMATSKDALVRIIDRHNKTVHKGGAK